MAQDVPLFWKQIHEKLNQIQANTYRENNNSTIYYQQKICVMSDIELTLNIFELCT